MSILTCFLSLADFDANNIFKAFFGSPGGFSFEGDSNSYIFFFEILK